MSLCIICEKEKRKYPIGIRDHHETNCVLNAMLNAYGETWDISCG